jgi:hypothetical protein
LYFLKVLYDTLIFWEAPLIDYIIELLMTIMHFLLNLSYLMRSRSYAIVKVVFLAVRCVPYCRCFETRGVPGPTSELSPCAPAQMGRRKAEREGGKGGSRREAGVRECGSRGLRVSPAPESGALAVGGYKRPRGSGSERP